MILPTRRYAAILAVLSMTVSGRPAGIVMDLCVGVTHCAHFFGAACCRSPSSGSAARAGASRSTRC